MLHVTWEEAFNYVNANIDKWCAEQGVGVEINDPLILQASGRILRVGRNNLNATRVKVPTTTTRS